MNVLFKYLTHSEFSKTENFVLWTNLLTACFAFWFNRKAYKSGIPQLRKSAFLTAWLAVLYVAAYLFLILTNADFFAWSGLIRGISIVAWIIVWIQPARVSVKVWKAYPTDIRDEMRLTEENKFGRKKVKK